MSAIEQTALLKLGPELGKDFKLVVDSCFDGNYDQALREAVVMLVNKEKLLCHNFEETQGVAFMKIVDKVFNGNVDEAVREAANLLTEKYTEVSGEE